MDLLRGSNQQEPSRAIAPSPTRIWLAITVVNARQFFQGSAVQKGQDCRLSLRETTFFREVKDDDEVEKSFGPIDSACRNGPD
jgi:hypothetical protein